MARRVKVKRPVWRWPAHQVSTAGLPRMTSVERAEYKKRQLSWLTPDPDVTPDGKRAVR
jgi:hypothetical protein